MVEPRVCVMLDLSHSICVFVSLLLELKQGVGYVFFVEKLFGGVDDSQVADVINLVNFEVDGC